jgi:hypothetical protein
MLMLLIHVHASGNSSHHMHPVGYQEQYMAEAARHVVSDPKRTLLDHAEPYLSAAQAHTVRLM